MIWIWYRRRPKPQQLFVIGLTQRAREVLGLPGGARRSVDSIPQWPVWIGEGGLWITVDGASVRLGERGLSVSLGVTKAGSVATCELVSASAEVPVPVRGRLNGAT